MQHVCYTDTYIGLKSQLGNNHKSRASQKSYFPPDLSSLLLTLFQKEAMRTKKSTSTLLSQGSSQWLCMLSSTTIPYQKGNGEDLAEAFSRELEQMTKHLLQPKSCAV